MIHDLILSPSLQNWPKAFPSTSHNFSHYSLATYCLFSHNWSVDMHNNWGTTLVISSFNFYLWMECWLCDPLNAAYVSQFPAQFPLHQWLSSHASISTYEYTAYHKFSSPNPIENKKIFKVLYTIVMAILCLVGKINWFFPLILCCWC